MKKNTKKVQEDALPTTLKALMEALHADKLNANERSMFALGYHAGIGQFIAVLGDHESDQVTWMDEQEAEIKRVLSQDSDIGPDIAMDIGVVASRSSLN
jgi:hypothetical protein